MRRHKRFNPLPIGATCLTVSSLQPPHAHRDGRKRHFGVGVGTVLAAPCTIVPNGHTFVQLWRDQLPVSRPARRDDTLAAQTRMAHQSSVVPANHIAHNCFHIASLGNVSMKLHECLTHAPYAVLLRISKHYAVPIGHDCQRAHVLDRLLDAPLRYRIEREIARLDRDRLLRPLQLLAREGGHVERVAFERAFGPCLVPRSGAIDPSHVAAHLAACGIIFALADQVVLPEEFLFSIPPIHESLPLLDQERLATPLYDLAIMLIAAHRGTLLLDRRDGRLTRRTITDLLPVCSLTASPESLQFLAHVAVLARLLEPAPAVGAARPGPALDAWLALGPAEQSHTLWQAWPTRATPRTKRQAARQDTCRQCLWLRDGLARMLTDSIDDANNNRAEPQRPPGVRLTPRTGAAVILHPGRLALLRPALTCVRDGACPTFHSAGTPATRCRIALDMLTGPFYWLGVTLMRTLPNGDIAVTITPVGMMLVADAPAPHASPTPWSYAETSTEPGAASPGAASPPPLRLAVPPDAPCAALLRLSDSASPVPDAPGLWQVETRRAARLLDDKSGVDNLVAFLETATGAPLPDRWRRALTSTDGQRPEAIVRPVLLLESGTPLPSLTPALSTVLARTLSPRAAVVYPRDVPALRRVLTRRGIDLRVEGRDDSVGVSGGHGAAGHGDREDPLWVSRRLRVAAAVGLAVLHALDARGVPTPPLPTPAALSLTEDEQTAAAVWTRRILARLDTTAGVPAEAPTPPDTAVLDRSVLSAIIARAIEDGHLLRLRYHGPSDVAADAPERTVEPHRLETRHGHTYLRAYCHRRDAERLFRLDRIIACDPVARADTP